MLISYRKIHRKVRLGSAIIDPFYDLTAGDFFSASELLEMEHNNIYHVIANGKIKRGELPAPFPGESFLPLLEVKQN